LNSEKPEYLLEKYYDYYEIKDIGDKKGQQKARCRICKKELARNGGSTRSMTTHLMGLHKNFYELYEAARQKSNLQQRRLTQAALLGCELNIL
jgi:hypothetical protein